MSSSFAHVVVHDRISFLFKAEGHPIVYIPHLLIYPSVDTWVASPMAFHCGWDKAWQWLAELSMAWPWPLPWTPFLLSLYSLHPSHTVLPQSVLSPPSPGLQDSFGIGPSGSSFTFFRAELACSLDPPTWNNTASASPTTLWQLIFIHTVYSLMLFTFLWTHLLSVSQT